MKSGALQMGEFYLVMEFHQIGSSTNLATPTSTRLIVDTALSHVKQGSFLMKS